MPGCGCFHRPPCSSYRVCCTRFMVSSDRPRGLSKKVDKACNRFMRSNINVRYGMKHCLPSSRLLRCVNKRTGTVKFRWRTLRLYYQGVKMGFFPSQKVYGGRVKTSCRSACIPEGLLFEFQVDLTISCSLVRVRLAQFLLNVLSCRQNVHDLPILTCLRVVPGGCCRERLKAPLVRFERLANSH